MARQKQEYFSWLFGVLFQKNQLYSLLIAPNLFFVVSNNAVRIENKVFVRTPTARMPCNCDNYLSLCPYILYRKGKGESNVKIYIF